MLLILLGVRFWLALPFDQMPIWIDWLGLGIGLCLSMNPFFNQNARVAVGRLRRFLGKHRIAAPIIIALIVCSYLMMEVWHGRQEMFLRLHDEHSYMIQARMLARGKLWSGAYPPDISPFFDTFHFIVDRVYASIYFPGAAMTMVPAVWLGLPYWVSPLVCGAAAAGMFYLVMREIFGSLRALIAVLMLVPLQYFRWMSFMLMSETSLLLAAMTLTWAWLRWRRRKTFAWAMLMGAAGGWAAITRPLDAMCFIAAIAAAIAVEMRTRPIAGLRAFAAVALAALPFAAIQIAQNIGVTGKWNQTAMQYYIAESYPAPVIGFHTADVKNLPAGLSAPKRDFIERWMVYYREHTLRNVLKTWFSVRFNQIRQDTVPDTDLFLLFPLALASRLDIRKLAIVAAMILILVVYLGYIFYLDQYLVATMPGMICIVLMGWEGLERAWPRYRGRIAGFIAPALIGFSLGAMPEFQHRAWAMPNVCEPARQINDDLSALTTPSVVLFPFGEAQKGAVDWFPVYNTDVACPDDALVIRANDLGANQNRKLYDYYARIQPDRRFYIYDPVGASESHNLKYLGTARELAANPANHK